MKEGNHWDGKTMAVVLWQVLGLGRKQRSKVVIYCLVSVLKISLVAGHVCARYALPTTGQFSGLKRVEGWLMG